MKVGKLLPKTLKNKGIIKSERATVVISKVPEQKDKSRFFKKSWEVEKRQLFLS